MFTKIKVLLNEWFPGHDFILDPQNQVFNALLQEKFVIDLNQPELFSTYLDTAKTKIAEADPIQREYVEDDITTFLAQPNVIKILADMSLKNTRDIIKDFFGEQGKNLTLEQIELLQNIKIIIKGQENVGVYSYPHGNSSQLRKRPYAKLSLTELYLLLKHNLFFHNATVPGNTSGTWRNSDSFYKTSILGFNPNTHSIEIIIPNTILNMGFTDKTTQSLHEILQTFTMSHLFPTFLNPNIYNNPRFFKALTDAVHHAIPTYQAHTHTIYQEFFNLQDFSVQPHEGEQNALKQINLQLGTNISYSDGILSFPNTEKNNLAYELIQLMSFYNCLKGKQDLVAVCAKLPTTDKTVNTGPIYNAEHVKTALYGWMMAILVMGELHDDEAGLSKLGKLLTQSVDNELGPHAVHTLPCDHLTSLSLHELTALLNDNQKTQEIITSYQESQQSISMAELLTEPLNLESLNTKHLINQAYNDNKIPFYVRRIANRNANMEPLGSLNKTIEDELRSYDGSRIRPLTMIRHDLFASLYNLGWQNASGYVFFGNVNPVIFYKKPAISDVLRNENSSDSNTFDFISKKIVNGGKPKRTLQEFVAKLQEMAYRLKGVLGSTNTKQFIKMFLESYLEYMGWNKLTPVQPDEQMLNQFKLHLHATGVKKNSEYYEQTVSQFIRMIHEHSGQTYQVFLVTLSKNAKTSFPHQNTLTQFQPNEVLAKPNTYISANELNPAMDDLEKELIKRTVGNIAGVYINTNTMEGLVDAWSCYYHLLSYFKINELLNESQTQNFNHLPSFIMYSQQTSQIEIIDEQLISSFYQMLGQVILFNEQKNKLTAQQQQTNPNTPFTVNGRPAVAISFATRTVTPGLMPYPNRSSPTPPSGVAASTSTILRGLRPSAAVFNLFSANSTLKRDATPEEMAVLIETAKERTALHLKIQNNLNNTKQGPVFSYYLMELAKHYSIGTNPFDTNYLSLVRLLSQALENELDPNWQAEHEIAFLVDLIKSPAPTFVASQTIFYAILSVLSLIAHKESSTVLLMETIKTIESLLMNLDWNILLDEIINLLKNNSDKKLKNPTLPSISYDEIMLFYALKLITDHSEKEILDQDESLLENQIYPTLWKMLAQTPERVFTKDILNYVETSVNQLLKLKIVSWNTLNRNFILIHVKALLNVCSDQATYLALMNTEAGKKTLLAFLNSLLTLWEEVLKQNISKTSKTQKFDAVWCTKVLDAQLKALFNTLQDGDKLKEALLPKYNSCKQLIEKNSEAFDFLKPKIKNDIFRRVKKENPIFQLSIGGTINYKVHYIADLPKALYGVATRKENEDLNNVREELTSKNINPFFKSTLSTLTFRDYKKEEPDYPYFTLIKHLADSCEPTSLTMESLEKAKTLLFQLQHQSDGEWKTWKNANTSLLAYAMLIESKCSYNDFMRILGEVFDKIAELNKLHPQSPFELALYQQWYQAKKDHPTKQVVSLEQVISLAKENMHTSSKELFSHLWNILESNPVPEFAPVIIDHFIERLKTEFGLFSTSGKFIQMNYFIDIINKLHECVTTDEHFEKLKISALGKNILLTLWNLLLANWKMFIEGTQLALTHPNTSNHNRKILSQIIFDLKENNHTIHQRLSTVPEFPQSIEGLYQECINLIEKDGVPLAHFEGLFELSTKLKAAKEKAEPALVPETKSSGKKRKMNETASAEASPQSKSLKSDDQNPSPGFFEPIKLTRKRKQRNEDKKESGETSSIPKPTSNE